MTNNVRPINRTEVIRRIFGQRGLDLANSLVHDLLATEGLFVSDSLITSTRKRLLSDKAA